MSFIAAKEFNTHFHKNVVVKAAADYILENVMKISCEKPLQNDYIALLNIRELPFLHINNKGQKKGVYKDSLGEGCTTNFPDLLFPYNGKFHFREFGVEGRHKGRKSKQLFKAGWWARHGGATVLIINSRKSMEDDWKQLGLT